MQVASLLRKSPKLLGVPTTTAAIIETVAPQSSSEELTATSSSSSPTESSLPSSTSTITAALTSKLSLPSSISSREKLNNGDRFSQEYNNSETSHLNNISSVKNLTNNITTLGPIETTDTTIENHHSHFKNKNSQLQLQSSTILNLPTKTNKEYDEIESESATEEDNTTTTTTKTTVATIGTDITEGNMVSAASSLFSPTSPTQPPSLTQEPDVNYELNVVHMTGEETTSSETASSSSTTSSSSSLLSSSSSLSTSLVLLPVKENITSPVTENADFDNKVSKESNKILQNGSNDNEEDIIITKSIVNAAENGENDNCTKTDFVEMDTNTEIKECNNSNSSRDAEHRVQNKISQEGCDSNSESKSSKSPIPPVDYQIKKYNNSNNAVGYEQHQRDTVINTENENCFKIEQEQRMEILNNCVLNEDNSVTSSISEHIQVDRPKSTHANISPQNFMYHERDHLQSESAMNQQSYEIQQHRQIQQFHSSETQHQLQQIHHQQQQSNHSYINHQQNHSITCIDDLILESHRHEESDHRYKLLPSVIKHENHDDGYETSGGDILTPTSHVSTPSNNQIAIQQQHGIHHSNLLRPTTSTIDDPYKFIDDELNSSMNIISSSSNTTCPVSLRSQQQQSGYTHGSHLNSNILEDGKIVPLSNGQILERMPPQLSINDTQMPKKRGRKKKNRDENGQIVNSFLKPITHKERKKHDRFNGMPEEEVSKRTLPDHLANNLDIIIIGINPGLFAAYKGHHYAGPGNHFWKCLYLSGLTHEQMTAEEDYKLLEFGIGFTNMVERATKGSADLTRKEIKEGCRILLEKLRKFRPKIAVFNGKLIFEVFSGKKDFNFGRQPECVEGTNTYMWVMPSSSARCAQLPRAADKVPFYTALKKFRDYLNGLIPHIDESECVFTDPKFKAWCESEPKNDSTTLGYGENITDLSSCNLTSTHNTIKCRKTFHNGFNIDGEDGTTPCKKRRGRPKKIRDNDGLGNENGSEKRIGCRMATGNEYSSNDGLNLNNTNNNGEMPKKKRGRPKKIKVGDVMNVSNSPMSFLNGAVRNNNNCNIRVNNDMTNGLEAINNSDIDNGNLNEVVTGVCGSVGQQHQRLFSPPTRSPSTVSSLCGMGVSSSTPPMNNNNNNNNNSSNVNEYHHQHHHHQQQHHPIESPHHQSQYLHNIHQQHQQHQHYQHVSRQAHSQSSQQYTPHSDLSSEISAAISSEHLGESPTPNSPNLGPPDFDPPNSIQNDDVNHELRFSSPSSTISEQQQTNNTHIGSHLGGFNNYRNPGSNNSYLSANGLSSNEDNASDTYLKSQQQQTQQVQQTTSNIRRQHSLQLTDVASKSLSGLESLVDQIPTMTDNDGASTPSVNHLAAQNQDDNYSTNCLYSSYSNNLQLTSSTSPSITPNSSSLLSSPSYSNYSSVNVISTSCTTPPSSCSYGSLSSNFSVSSLTSTNYPTSSYHHTNLMTPSSHHLVGTSGSNPMYMEPHIPVPVNPLYHHPYSQHSSYGGYNVGPPPTLHMPSPNYPYGYGNTSVYPQTGHHPAHHTAGYLSNHTSMFDRLKSDIGYNGF